MRQQISSPTGGLALEPGNSLAHGGDSLYPVGRQSALLFELRAQAVDQQGKAVGLDRLIGLMPLGGRKASHSPSFPLRVLILPRRIALLIAWGDRPRRRAATGTAEARAAGCTELHGAFPSCSRH